MSGLFDDEGKREVSEANEALAEGKPPARGRKHKASEASVAELSDETIRAEQEAQRQVIDQLPPTSDEMAKAAQEFDQGHPFEDSIRAAKAIAADEMYVPGWPGFKKVGPSGEREMVNRFPISQERRQRMLNLVWERTKYKTGRVEWRDVRDLLKDVIELL